MNAFAAGATGIDSAADEFRASVVGAGDIANHPNAVEQRALVRDSRFFDVNDRLMQIVATKLELILVAAHENLIGVAVNIDVGTWVETAIHLAVTKHGLRIAQNNIGG